MHFRPIYRIDNNWKTMATPSWFSIYSIFSFYQNIFAPFGTVNDPGPLSFTSIFQKTIYAFGVFGISSFFCFLLFVSLFLSLFISPFLSRILFPSCSQSRIRINHFRRFIPRKWKIGQSSWWASYTKRIEWKVKNNRKRKTWKRIHFRLGWLKYLFAYFSDMHTAWTSSSASIWFSPPGPRISLFFSFVFVFFVFMIHNTHSLFVYKCALAQVFTFLFHDFVRVF